MNQSPEAKVILWARIVGRRLATNAVQKEPTICCRRASAHSLHLSSSKSATMKNRTPARTHARPFPASARLQVVVLVAAAAVMMMMMV